MSPTQRIESASRYADRDMFKEAWQEMQAITSEARNTRRFLKLVASVAPSLGKWHDAAEANRLLVSMEPILLHWMCWGVSVRRSLRPLAAAGVWAEAARRHPQYKTWPDNPAAALCEAGRIGEARRRISACRSVGSVNSEVLCNREGESNAPSDKEPPIRRPGRAICQHDRGGL